MSFGTPTGGCSATLHAIVSYPKTAALVAALAACGYGLTQVTATEQTTLSAEACEVAPMVTTNDLFLVSGTKYSWNHPGSDPVRGNPAEPYLVQLEFNKEERAEFLRQIEAEEGSLSTFKYGDSIGRMTSGSGETYEDTIVGFHPIAQTGDDHTKDNRILSYTQDVVVRIEDENGEVDCLKVRKTLLQPLVCDNWSRPSDQILAIMSMRRIEDEEQE